MGAIVAATDETFEELVLQGDRPVIVEFWARWAANPGGPCQLLEPVIGALAERYDGAVDVVTVEVEDNPELTKVFNIQSIPTLAFFQRGQQPLGIVGFRPTEQVEAEFGLAAFLPASPAGRRSGAVVPEATATLLEQLRQLGELRSGGLITDDEFAEMKGRVLAEHAR